VWFPTSASSNAAEVKRVDANRGGVISAAEGDADTSSDGFEDNSRLFIPATQYNRFAVTQRQDYLVDFASL